MTRDEIEPMVPVMPTEDTTQTIRADGGEASRASRASSDAVASDGGRREHLGADDVAAPLVPDLR